MFLHMDGTVDITRFKIVKSLSPKPQMRMPDLKRRCFPLSDFKVPLGILGAVCGNAPHNR